MKAFMPAAGVGRRLYGKQHEEPPKVLLSFEGETPVAVAMLIATAAGILLTATAGSLRIIQLRRRTKKDLKNR